MKEQNMKHKTKQKILISSIISVAVTVFLVFNCVPLYKIVTSGILIWLAEYGLLTTTGK
jgi:predicted ABC-type exoprotein transport system permease subunit